MPDFHKQRVVGRIFKLLFTLLIVAVNAILIWRVFFSTNLPSSIKPLTPNAALSQAYAQEGDDLTLRYQNNHTTVYAEGKMGYFSTSEAIFIPAANQVQVVVRYSNSTLTHLAEDYALEGTPDKSREWFDFSLVVATDITPDDPNDNNTPASFSYARVKPSAVTRDTSLLYTYYRLVFDGITVEPTTDGIFLDAYYLGDVNYDADAYGTLCVYDCRMKWQERELSKADKKALAD